VSHDQTHNRREYAHGALRRAELRDDPLQQFKRWLEEALAAELIDATACALATVNDAGQPSNRIVLLKSFDAEGFTWFTDYRSRKGADLAHNPQAALLFFWREFERQVRIEGTVHKVPRAVSETYFASRPIDSRLAAAASHQSAPVPDRDSLERAVQALREAHPSGDIPTPQDWSGFCLVPPA